MKTAPQRTSWHSAEEKSMKKNDNKVHLSKMRLQTIGIGRFSKCLQTASTEKFFEGFRVKTTPPHRNHYAQ